MAFRTGTSLRALDSSQPSPRALHCGTLEKGGKGTTGAAELKVYGPAARRSRLDCRCSKQDEAGATGEVGKGATEGSSNPIRSTSSKTLQGPSAKSSLAFLDQYASASENAKPFDLPSNQVLTIAEQLKNQMKDFENLEEVTIPLGKNFKKPKLTISQKRNIRRQAYLTTVSKRNDSLFFLTIGMFVILPPIFILGIAIAIGYIDVLP